jgi:predicted nucleic acid-binding protein
MPILIDSTVLIERTHRSERIMSVTPVRTEVLGGIPDGGIPGALDTLGMIDWLDVTIELADVAAALARRYSRAHSGIGVVDYLIAAAAIRVDAIVATHNVRDFPMFPGLQPPY